MWLIDFRTTNKSPSSYTDIKRSFQAACPLKPEVARLINNAGGQDDERDVADETDTLILLISLWFQS